MKTQSIISKLRKTNNRGSLLLEVAIALCVISVISGFFVSKGMILNRSLRSQAVKSNIEYVTIALSAYLSNYNRLPRPAHDKSGVECIATGSNLSDYIGTVPFNTLGIPEKYTLDEKLKPLVYIVEPELTGDFNSIYEKEIDRRDFCKGIVLPSIVVNGICNQPPDVIAFVIDTKEPVISDKIFVTPSYNTNWISRNLILMRYLKNAPCERETPHRRAQVDADEFCF